jgi:hypothetical protein
LQPETCHQEQTITRWRKIRDTNEDVTIEVRTPEESIINADWVCPWDCNTGLYQQGFRH